MEAVYQVRASYMLLFRRALDRLSSVEQPVVFPHVADETIHKVNRSRGMGWLPVEFNLELTRAVAQLGPRRTERFYRELWGVALGNRLYQTLVRAVRRYGSNNPARYLRWVPKVYGLTFRGCGEFEFAEVESGNVLITGVGLPSKLVNDRAWVSSLSASMGAVWELSGYQGTNDLTSSSGESPCYRFVWDPDQSS